MDEASAQNTPSRLRVLMVEDIEDDAMRVLRLLRRAGYAVQHERVDSKPAMQAALERHDWDLVISDFAMPGFDGRASLALVRERYPELPFILVSGTVGEEIAVGMMKAGASDYVMKDNLSRLLPAVQRELRDAHARRERRAALDALAESELRFRQLAGAIDEVFFVRDPVTLQMFYVSPAYEKIWGRSCASLYADSRSWFHSVHPDDRDRVRALLSTGTPSYDFQYRMVRPDGALRCIRVRGFPVFDSAGKYYRTAGVASDVTQAQEAAHRIAQLNRVYAMLSGIKGVIVRVRERGDLLQQACEIAVRAGGFRMAWIGMVDSAGVTVSLAASAGVDDDLAKTIAEGLELREGTVAARVMAGEVLVFNALAESSKSGFGKKHVLAGIASMAMLPLTVERVVVGVLALCADSQDVFREDELALLSGLASDIAFGIDHIDKQERIDYLAYYDVLTGLAGRTLFLERVALCLRSAAGAGHRACLFLLDLERFKNINDSVGRSRGDHLLQQVASWLSSTVGDASMVARVSADQFAALCAHVDPDEDLGALIEQRLTAFQTHPFYAGGSVMRLAFKAGLSVFPDDGMDAEALFRNAEAALKQAKARGERFMFYAPTMTSTVADKVTLEYQLRQALDKGEFELHYQPKIRLADGALCGAEALIRWNDPRTGLVAPARFIPVLEETGLIYEVGRWALRQAITDYLRWRGVGLPAMRIAVNVSPLQLRRTDFVAEIGQLIAAEPRAAHGLELEMTESLIMEDVNHSIASLQAIRALGVQIAIDDFGTGFSSLSYLARLPLDTLKIDRSFVQRMSTGPQGLALVSTIVDLAHAMNLVVVAEGVETEEESRLLRLLSCDEMQGYLFSKPLPADVFEARYATASPLAPAH
ncbi:MAG: EAL domain-containing protein [Burkholderiaceae bacterium]